MTLHSSVHISRLLLFVQILLTVQKLHSEQEKEPILIEVISTHLKTILSRKGPIFSASEK